MSAPALGRTYSSASTVVMDKRAAQQPPPKMRERMIAMRAPTEIVHNQANLLADVRGLLSPWPPLVDHPDRIASLLEAEEDEVRAVLEALEVEGEVLS